MSNSWRRPGSVVWQMLPTMPTHEDLSPYNTLSAFAGEPRLISPERLVHDGWLPAPALEELVAGQVQAADLRRQALARAHRQLMTGDTAPRREEFVAFCDQEQAWLDDYALFMTLHAQYDDQDWTTWPEPLRRREAQALAQVWETQAEQINYYRFEQFMFARQWQDLRESARQHGVLLFGDLPMFVAHDSADVWACQHQFKLDVDGQPLTVAGVPPDYFSPTGQRWGNPLYDWVRMAEDGFDWWLRRVGRARAQFDLVRVDHFRGFAAFWEIPVDCPDAVGGHWVAAPGAELLARLMQGGAPLPLVAENLGVITADVEALRKRFALPGMCILQFGFDGHGDNPNAPHCHDRNEVVYTGTHDNDTTLGWYRSLDDGGRALVARYLGQPGEVMPWLLIRSALASVGRLAVIPMQDLLELGSESRMNTPGTENGNWRWQYAWQQVSPTLAGRLRELVALYGRL